MVVYSDTVLISTHHPTKALNHLPTLLNSVRQFCYYYDYFIFRQEGCPRIHLGPVAAGRHVVKEDRLRQQFATQVGALAFDCEFDSVIESILGNCKDSFVCIRGKYTKHWLKMLKTTKLFFSRYFRLQRWHQTQRVAAVRLFSSSQRYEKHHLWNGTAY